ncbi:MAG: hypothetical protein Q9224_004978 [Gallowayella concinna]
MHRESLNGDATPANPPTRVFHVVNPFKASWTDLAHVIQKTIASIDGLLPYSDWLNLLKKSISQIEVSEGTPLGRAMTLLPFFEKLGLDEPSTAAVVLDSTVTRAASPTLGALQAVSEDWLVNWIKQWGLE